MTDDPIDLDAHRGMAAQKATEERRQSEAVRADQAMLRHRRDEMETSLTTGPATSWPDLAAKAAFLITLFAETAEGRDPRHRKLIESALDDIRRFTDQASSGSPDTTGA